jgi:hypothetical protein
MWQEHAHCLRVDTPHRPNYKAIPIIVKFSQNVCVTMNGSDLHALEQSGYASNLSSNSKLI